MAWASCTLGEALEENDTQTTTLKPQETTWFTEEMECALKDMWGYQHFSAPQCFRKLHWSDSGVWQWLLCGTCKVVVVQVPNRYKEDNFENKHFLKVCFLPPPFFCSCSKQPKRYLVAFLIQLTFNFNQEIRMNWKYLWRTAPWFGWSKLPVVGYE